MTTPEDHHKVVPGAPSFLVAGMRIDAYSLDQAVDAVLEAAGPASVHLCNAYTVALASRDTGLLETINAGTMNLADGMPLVWIARRLGFRDMTRRVYGPDLMEAVIDRGQDVGTKHYLYGSSPDVLEQLRLEVVRRWPRAVVAGVESPPFDRPITDADLATSVRAMTEVGADVVWLGMGTPKQDELVERYKALGSQRFVAIGAAFDFIAGNKRQAPAWLQRLGLEWLFRLMTEPRRLWRRYLLGNARFLWVVLRTRPRRAPAKPTGPAR